MGTKIKHKIAVEAAKSFSHSLSKSSGSPSLAMIGLSRFLNFSQYDRAKFYAIIEILKISRNSNLLNTVIEMVHAKYHSWFHIWDLNEDASRILALSVADTLSASSDSYINEKAILIVSFIGISRMHAYDSNTFHIRYKEQAVRTLRFYLCSNTLFPFKLTHLHVIKQLANDPEFGKIFDLTRLMLNGETKNYQHEV